MKSSILFSHLICLILIIASCGPKVQTDGDPNPPMEGQLQENDLRFLTGRAGIIFKGVVSAIEYETDTKTGLPYTYVTFRQIEAIKDLTGKFKSGSENKIRIRNFGGLREDGKIFEMSHVPDFQLGFVYVVFYTTGEWDVTPVVGGEQGAFQVLKSSTLGHEMLLNHAGQVVVSIVNDSIVTSPLAISPAEFPSQIQPEMGEVGNTQYEDSSQFRLDEKSIYTEENVERMMKGEEEPFQGIVKEDGSSKKRDSIKVQALSKLPSTPLSFKTFSEAILETDRKYRNDFAKYSSEVDFKGKPVQREKTPIAPKKQ